MAANLGSSVNVGTLLAYLGLDISHLRKNAKRAEGTIKRSTNNMTSTMRAFQNTVGALFVGFGVKQMADEFVEAGVKMDRMRLSMEAATGSSEGSAAALKYLQEQAVLLGRDFPTMTHGFSQLAAAARGTNVQGQQTVDIFESLMKASTALQMNQDQTEASIRAVVQIMSKGKVQAEELRGQLGERLPGAYRIAAKAMGMSTVELSKALDLGQIYSDDFLPKFAKALTDEFSGSWARSAQSIQANLDRLKTAWFNFRVAVFESGLGELFNQGVIGLTEFFVTFKENIGNMLNLGLSLVDGFGKLWIEMKHQWNIFTGFFELAWYNSVIAAKLLVMDFVDGIGKVFEAIPFMDDVAASIDAAARRVEATIGPIKTVADMVDEANSKKEEELALHNKIIHAIGVENDQYGKLSATMKTYAKAVGEGNEQSAGPAELTKSQLKELVEASKDINDMWGIMHEERYEVQARSIQAMIDLEEQLKEETEKRIEESIENQKKRAQGIQDYISQQSDLAGAMLESEKSMAEYKKKKEEEKQKLQETTMGNMVDDAKFAFKEFGKQNRAAFEAFKAISIAETVVNTYKAAQGAYSAMASIPMVGPALGVAAAAAAIAAGIARVSAISSMSPGGGASVSAGGGGAVGTYSADPTTGLPDTGSFDQNRVEIHFHNLTVDSDDRRAQLMDDFRNMTEELEIVSR